MKKYLFTIFCFFFYATSFAQLSQNQLSKKDAEDVIKTVKAYTDQLAAFASSLENIELMDSIFAKCENENIQTFDDLSPVAVGKSQSYKTCTLFQYLQNITTLYENNVDIKFSDFKCENTVVEPTSTSDFTTFAIVHVVKKIKANGIDRTEKQKITLNLGSMKIAGTVSEQYDDPNAVYLDALSLIRKNNTKEAKKLLEKCISYETYPGRYRAMMLVGNIYASNKSWDQAIEWYTKSSEQYTAAALALADLYSGQNKNVPSKYVDGSKALEIYQRYTSALDKDHPKSTYIALTSLMGIYAKGEGVPQDKEKAWGYVNKMEELVGEKPDFELEFLAIKAHILYYIYTGDYNSASALISFAGENLHHLNSTIQSVSVDELNKLKKSISSKTDIPVVDNSGDELVIEAKTCEANKKFAKALGLYEKAADAGNKEAEYVMFLYKYPLKKNELLLIGQDLGLKSNPQNIFQYIYHKSNNEKDKESAISYLERSAGKNFMSSRYAVGLIYMTDKAHMDREKGLEMYLRAMDDDSYENSMSRYETLCMVVGQSNKNIIIEKAKTLCEDCGAANWIMTSYYKEQKDNTKVKSHILKGSKLGFLGSIIDEYNMYLEEGKYTMASSAARTLGQRGYKKGYFMAGKALEDQKNYTRAKSHYNDGYKAKEPLSTYRLALLNHDGNGTTKDIRKAVELVTSAIEYAKDYTDVDTAEMSAAQKKWMDEAGIKSLDELKEQDNSDATTGAYAPGTYNPAVTEYDINTDIQKNVIAAQLAGITGSALNPAIPKESIPKFLEPLKKLVIENYFDSPKSEVKIVGTDGTTVVATKSIKDYVEDLAKMTKVPKIKVLEIQLASDNKAKKITIQVE